MVISFKIGILQICVLCFLVKVNRSIMNESKNQSLHFQGDANAISLLSKAWHWSENMWTFLMPLLKSTKCMAEVDIQFVEGWLCSHKSDNRRKILWGSAPIYTARFVQDCWIAWFSASHIANVELVYHTAVRRLTAKSREVSKPRDWVL